MLRKFGVYAMGILYTLAGLNHFIHPEVYLSIMPSYLPYPLSLIYISGMAEMVLGLLLLWVRFRRLAAGLIMVLLVLVFPANIEMLWQWQAQHHPWLWLAYARLPLQALLMYWAWTIYSTSKSPLTKG